MKIVEKKCPNCGANLDFKVGERDVTCSHCRRKYAVQYDGVDFARLGEEAIKSLKNIDIDLKPLRNVFVTIVCVIVAVSLLFIGGITLLSIRSQKAFEQRVEQSRQEYEQNIKDSEKEMEDWYERESEKLKNY